ncbi:RNA-directed DNA polymerase, eukaryota [Tanacetum coccineum]
MGVRGLYSHRSKEDHVTQISKSIFVTNFPKNFVTHDLWKLCEGYGKVVDVYIPNRKSKASKRFAFVRFIMVEDIDRLIGNLCTIWIGRLHLHANVVPYKCPRKPSNLAGHVHANMHAPFGSYAIVVKGNTQSNTPVTPPSKIPSLVLDDSCVIERDLSRYVMGRVKQLNSIPNLWTILTKESFPKVKLTYLGGMWVMIELDNEVTKQKMLQHIGVKSWFQVLQAAKQDFVSDERVIWVDIEGVPLNVWTRETFLKIGKVYMVRAKELFAWTPIFLDYKESEYISDDESLHGAENKLVGLQYGDAELEDDSDVEGVSEINFGDKPSSPNNSVCKRNEKTRQENVQVGVDQKNETDKVNSPLVHAKVMSTSQEVHENVASKGESALHSTHNSQTGGSILEVINDMIRAGQSMGYAMEGCMKDIENIIWSQGVDDVPQ